METRTEQEVEIIFNQVYDDINSNPEHKECELETKELGRKIIYLLGPDSEVFLNYEKHIYLMQGFCLESAYKIGLNKNHCGLWMSTKMSTKKLISILSSYVYNKFLRIRNYIVEI